MVKWNKRDLVYIYGPHCHCVCPLRSVSILVNYTPFFVINLTFFELHYIIFYSVHLTVWSLPRNVAHLLFGAVDIYMSIRTVYCNFRRVICTAQTAVAHC